jgi:hypothetical protein
MNKEDPVTSMATRSSVSETEIAKSREGACKGSG